MRNYSKLYGSIDKRAIDQTATPEEIRRQIEAAKTRVTENTYRSYCYALERIGQAAAELQLTPLPQLTVNEIESIGLKAIVGLKPATARTVLNVASIFIDRRFLWLAPSKSEVKKTRHPLSDDEIQKLLDAGGEKWKLPILIGVYTGMRISDVQSLRWSQIDGDTLIVETQKTKKVVQIPLHPELKIALSKSKKQSEMVCPGIAFYKGTGTSSLFIREVVHKAGMKGISFHWLRHTFVSRLHESGCPLPTALELAGHCSTMVHLTYAKPTWQRMCEAIKNLPDLKKQIDLL